MSAKSLPEFRGWYRRPKLSNLQIRKLKKLLHVAYGHREHKRRALFMHEAEGLNLSDHQIEPSLSYTPLSRFVGEVMEENHYNRETVVALLAELGVEGERPMETFLYGGCWHGDDPERVDRLFETPVDFAIFSDITGSDRVEESKKIFYNEIVNPASRLFKMGKLDDLGSFYNKEISRVKLRLKRGYRRLMEWRDSLAGGREKFINIDESDILDHILTFVDRKNPNFIKNHGEWMARLGREEREKILDMVKEDTVDFINILAKVKKRGTRVIVVEGNWDNTKTLKLVAEGVGNNERIADYFDTKGYLKRHGFEFYDKLGGIETKTAYHILVPFFFLREMDRILKSNEGGDRLKRMRLESSRAKKEGKTMVIYAHGVPYPKMHNLSESHLVLSEDNRVVSENLRELMVFFKPDEVIYPHYHDPRLDEYKRQVPADYHLLANVGKAGAPLIHTGNGSSFAKASEDKSSVTVLDYIPFREVAIKKISDRFNLPARVI